MGRLSYCKSNLFQGSHLAINVYATAFQATVSEYHTQNRSHRVIICWDSRSCLILFPLKPVTFCTVQADCSKVHTRSCIFPSEAMTSEYDAEKRPKGFALLYGCYYIIHVRSGFVIAMFSERMLAFL